MQKIRRLLRLIESLQSGHEYNARDLAELCGVSRRQVFRDIRALQDSGVAVQFDEAKQSYRVAQAVFLPATELTLQESLALIVLAQNLGGAEHGIPLQEPARDAALKLASSLPTNLRSYVGELTNVVRVRAEAPARLDHARGSLETVHQAFQLRRRLRITYHSLFEGRDLRTLISPYRLLYCRHAWYVVGRSSLHRSVRMFHLGRIRNCELTDDPFEIPARFSLAKHLGNAWRLIRERGGDQSICIRFQPLVATNVAEVVWHATQELHWNTDGTLDFRARVSGLGEISWWILGYGDQAEVLEPPELRELIAARVRNMHAHYHTSQAKSNRRSRSHSR